MTGAFAGKNLILIMMESVDDWLVTPEYMPNLYRLEQEGVYFRNYYAPIFLAAATFNSEFTANTGMIAPEYQVRNSYYSEHALPYSLPNRFRDAGYSLLSPATKAKAPVGHASMHAAATDRSAWSSDSSKGTPTRTLNPRPTKVSPSGSWWSLVRRTQMPQAMHLPGS